MRSFNYIISSCRLLNPLQVVDEVVQPKLAFEVFAGKIVEHKQSDDMAQTYEEVSKQRPSSPRFLFLNFMCVFLILMEGSTKFAKAYV